jgi:hypothetical protein
VTFPPPHPNPWLGDPAVMSVYKKICVPGWKQMVDWKCQNYRDDRICAPLLWLGRSQRQLALSGVSIPGSRQIL